MRIDYRILWFENDNTSFLNKRDFVAALLNENGFNLIEPQHEVDDSNIDNIDYDKFDLIIADMNLDKNIKAMKLLDTIRNKNIYTEVLFYSSLGEKAVREELANHNIDGAYCAGREAVDFEEKVESVIMTLIRKTQDLTNLRGLVMAEVSELDVKMKNIIIKYCDNNKDKQQNLKEYIVNKIEEKMKNELTPQIKCSKNCLHSWHNKDIVEFVDEQNFDSYSKARLINRILKNLKKQHPDFVNIYYNEIIKNRNYLAHCKSEIKEGNEVLITADGVKTFDDTEFKIIRQNIIKYENLFNSVYEEICQ